MPTDYLPPPIQATVDDLLEATGVPATVSRTSTTYLVEHGNDRVKLTCRYTRNSRGRFSYGSTLTVDDEPRERVNGVHAYARLLADPDTQHPNRTPGRELPPVHPTGPEHELPTLVAAMADAVAKQPKCVEVITGHSTMAQRKRWGAWTWHPLNDQDAVPDPTGYVVEALKDNGDRVQMHFQEHPKAPGLHYLSGVSGVDSQGRDLMDDHGEDISRAVEELLGIRVPQQANVDTGPTVHQGDTKGTVSNSVQVRKSTVFRI